MLCKWICISLLCVLTGFSYASEAKHSTPGQMVMKGEIIETACEIDYQDRVQWIDFGQLTAREIGHRSGNNLVRFFQVRLTDCSLESQFYPGVFYRSANVTFDSDRITSDDQIIGIFGDAKGFGIRLNDSRGNTITMGKPTENFSLKKGVNTLGFSATIVPLTHHIESGDFYATVRFFMDYL